MEYFALAHEYGHHVGRHGQSGTSENADGSGSEELGADMFARAISMRIGSESNPQNLFAMSGVGAVALLGILDLVTRSEAIIKTGSDESIGSGAHPPLRHRIEVIAQLDVSAPDDYQVMFADMRSCFLAIIEQLWVVLRPGYLLLFAEGLRPHSMGGDFRKWSSRIER
jgi:hypothetical protein